MHDAADAVAGPMHAEQVERVIPGVPRVDRNRLAAAGSDFHLSHKHPLLDLARRIVVVIVESDLAYDQDLGVLAQGLDAGGGGRVEPARIVRVHSHRGRDVLVSVGDADGRL